VKHQNKLLTKVNEQMEGVETQMIAVDGRLNNILAKGSICKLWIIIVIELIIGCFLISSL